MHDLQKSNSDIWARVDESDEPRVLLASSSGGTSGPRVCYAELDRERKIGSVGAGLIPSLYSRSDGVENDGKVKGLGVPPSVGYFITQCLTVLLVELNDVVDAVGVLGDQCTLLEQREDFGKVGPDREGLDILEKLILGDANERVFDPGCVSLSNLIG